MPTGLVSAFERPDIYKQFIIAEIKRQGGGQSAIDLLTDDIVWSEFTQRTNPEDVAWGALAVDDLTKV